MLVSSIGTGKGSGDSDGSNVCCCFLCPVMAQDCFDNYSGDESGASYWFYWFW